LQHPTPSQQLLPHQRIIECPRGPARHTLQATTTPEHRTLSKCEAPGLWLFLSLASLMLNTRAACLDNGLPTILIRGVVSWPRRRPEARKRRRSRCKRKCNEADSIVRTSCSHPTRSDLSLAAMIGRSISTTSLRTSELPALKNTPAASMPLPFPRIRSGLRRFRKEPTVAR
jgi:hypothetical protein